MLWKKHIQKFSGVIGRDMCKIVHQDCSKELAKDKSLPLNSYLVTYSLDNETRYDIVVCNKRSQIFDMYWDKYREGLKDIRWTDGKVNPKLWGVEPKEPKKKK
jgi:hypothetical protein